MKKLLLLITVFVSSFLFSQSPWTKEKGKYYTQVSFSTIQNYDTFFGDPEFSIDGEITDNTFQFYGEYGLTNKTSLLLNIPLKSISISDFTDPRIDCDGDCSQSYNDTALGNIEIGIKHNFYNKKWLLSTQFSVEANTSSFDEISGIRTGYDAFTFTPLLLAGRSLKKGYLQTFVGGNIRTNNYSSNFKIGGEVGAYLTKKIILAGFIDVVKSLENGDITFPLLNQLNALYVNDQEYGVFGVKLIGEISNNFGFTASLPSAFFGNNVPKQLAITTGIYYKI
jgi:hypothetical protein